MPALQEFLCRSKWMLIYMKKKETKERSYRVHTACFVHPRLRPRISVDSPRNLFRIFKRRDIFDFEHAAQGTQRQGVEVLLYNQ
jgi:hypothetical protein